MSVGDLLDRYGTTYAHHAGITLRDTPAPLYQLLVLTTLLSVRVQADLAVDAARELSVPIGGHPGRWPLRPGSNAWTRWVGRTTSATRPDIVVVG
jgi:hypothetical protein